MFKIVISDHLSDSGWAVLRSAEDVTLAGPFAEREAVLEAARDAHALIVRSITRVDRELLTNAPNLQVVARAGASWENINLDECTRRGIMVINVPDANVIALAEHALGMMLALARHIPKGYASLRAGEWRRYELMGVQLHGKTLGIIGYGRHGREVAARAQSFGMIVLSYDPYIDEGHARTQRVSIVGIDELLARSDFISLHATLTPETADILNHDAFSKMKEGVRIVNCTHAGLIDETALLEALDGGKVAGAALDFLKVEPPSPGHPLVMHPNVIVLPHLNQNTLDSQTATSRQAAEDALAALRGDDYRNVVNLPFRPGADYVTAKPYLLLAEKLGKVQGQLAGGAINRVEIEILGDGLQGLVRPVAAALLKGMLRPVDERTVNYVSAPVIAYEQNIQTTQTRSLELVDYPNLLSCRAHWPGGSRTLAGVIFAGGEPRLVQYETFRIDANPEGYVLVLENEDVPGVIGQVGALMGAHGVNIGEWRYGRDRPGGRAVSFINLDSPIPAPALETLRQLPNIIGAKLVKL
ncbi:MAG: phosphoglycerate dehydrogenase [Chloroflexi bacterium]|nr:phosphoglycerate dehydrogenase [Chloroflexota bacterium]